MSGTWCGISSASYSVPSGASTASMGGTHGFGGTTLIDSSMSSSIEGRSEM